MTFDLRVPGELLEETGRSLGMVSAEFASADDQAEACAEAVGNDLLAEAVRSFADNWNHSRAEIRSAIGGLGETAMEAARVFEEIETTFVQGLVQTQAQSQALHHGMGIDS